MIRIASVLAVLTGPISAQSLCEDLDQHTGDILRLSQGDASCTNSLALGGGRSIHCALEFPYRSDAAARVFEELVDEITECVGSTAVSITDLSVNHPDAYDLRTFEDGARSYSVSIKDKGELQQTLVFVRVSRP